MVLFQIVGENNLLFKVEYAVTCRVFSQIPLIIFSKSFYLNFMSVFILKDLNFANVSWVWVDTCVYFLHLCNSVNCIEFPRLRILCIPELNSTYFGFQSCYYATGFVMLLFCLGFLHAKQWRMWVCIFVFLAVFHLALL